MATVQKNEIYNCSICGKETEWDFSIGENPICVDCWDSRAGADNEIAAKQRHYREEHKDEIAAKQRHYREEHKDEIAAKKRQFYKEHKDEIAAKQRHYREEHKDEIAAKHRQFYKEHKDEIAAKQRQFYKEHKDEITAKQRQFYKEHKDEIAAKQRHYREEHKMNSIIVPPRPAGIKESYLYYEKHRAEIIADYQSIGEKVMLKRWNISQATWLVKLKDGRWKGLAVRWGIVKSPVEPKKAKAKPEKPDKEPDEICKDCELAVLFRGYRMAVQDIFGVKK
jgi:hypothetical protein